MTTKSLLQFTHTSIGSKTHKARTATAHVSYIMRSDAMVKFQCEHMPDGGRGTRVFFDKLWEKAGMPESARICDKFMIALPLELSPEQRYEVLRSFMHELGQGRIAWCAAHHEQGKDSHNPHAHIVFKDADITTGHKVIGTTTCSRDVRDAKAHGWKMPPRATTTDLRKMWCDHLNDFMEGAGLDIRYDPRKLKDQGIDREAQIHVGPKAQELDEKDYAFESHDHMRNGHSLPYTLIDGESRARHNRAIIARNKERELSADSAPQFGASRRDDPEMRALMQAQDRARRAMYQEQQRDRDALRLAQDPAWLEHRKWAKKLYKGARRKAFAIVKEQYAGKWTEVRSITDLKEREKAAAALKAEQKKTYAEEASRQVKLCRPQKDAAWKPIHAEQDKERRELTDQHRQETSALARQHTAERQGLWEKRRTRSIEKRADKIDARLTSRPGMVPQQTAANDLIKLYKKATSKSPKEKGDRIPSVNPREAYRDYYNTAWVEQKRQTSIRHLLLKSRAKNLERAGLSPVNARDASAQRQAAQSASPREIIAGAVRAARENQLRDSDRQQQIRQAAATGRALTGDERANASPDLKDKIAGEDRRTRQLSLFILNKDGKQNRGKDGRSGGGRGR